MILINPVGGNQDAEAIYNDIVGPYFTLAGIHCDVLGQLHFFKSNI